MIDILLVSTDVTQPTAAASNGRLGRKYAHIYGIPYIHLFKAIRADWPLTMQVTGK